MTPELKQKWVDALRSGKYRQGREYLHRKRDSEDTYCCLGVLHDVSGGEWAEIINCYVAIFPDGTASTATLIGQLEKIDLSLFSHNTLWKMNDDYGNSFNEIANWIEKNI